jgi:hypothetical protein
MQRIAMFLLVLLVTACQKDQLIDVGPSLDDAAQKQNLRNPEKLSKESMKMHLSKSQAASILEDLDWSKYAIIRKNSRMLAAKIPFLKYAANEYNFVIVNIEAGKPTTYFQNEISYKLERGKRTMPESLRHYDFQTKVWKEYDFTGKKEKKNGGLRSVSRMSLVSPGGSLPMVTIVGTYSDGSSAGTIFSGSTAYMMASVFGVSGVSGGDTDNGLDPTYQYLDYLDPMYTPDAGSSAGLIQTEVIEWEMDESPSQEAVDINEYLRCFDNISDAGATYSIKVLVDIPVDANPNSLINVGATGLSVGHVFLSITKTNGSNSVSQTLGFYPASDYKSLTLSPVSSKLADDGKSGATHEFNASLSLDGWNTAEFKALLNQLRLNSTMKYEIDGFNCANFIGASLNAVKPNTLNSVATTGINPLNPSELISIPWSPNGVYKALVDQKASNPYLPINTGVIDKSGNSSGPCF